MKRFIGIAVIILFAMVACEDAPRAGDPAKKEITKESLKTPDDIASYGMGLGMGKNFLKKVEFDLDFELFIKGIKDGYDDDAKQLMSDEELKKEMTAFQETLKARQLEKRTKQSAENKAKGDKFLAENKKKKGVVSLPSGLQYKIVKKGAGPSPKATDTVKVHYRGTTIDGKEFDSSYKRDKPATFPLNRVVKGWTEALQLMKVGAKWQLTIPPEIGYGERGAGRNIGPNAVLLFEIELLGIEEPKPAKKK
jgi:FKBP-type peptidyl-prolyl cis-trans isomerase FklB